MIQQRVFVTGAGGFVGRNVCAGLLKAGFGVLGITRKCGSLPIGVENVVVGCIDDCTNFLDDLAGCNVVVHLAARVHVTKETSFDPLTEFRQMNVRSTLNLARQAAMAGIRRFVFISSIGVNGAATFQKPFAEHDPVAPHSPYAVSKHEAELGLQALAAETGMEVVIIRPPLVYGPNAPGNFGALIRAVQRGWPLPLGAIHNKRSLIGLDNLVNFIVTCVNHPSAANQTFLISDGQDVSTTELVCGIAQAMAARRAYYRCPLAG